MIKPINHRKDRTRITSCTKILLVAALVGAVAFGAGGISTDANMKKALSDRGNGSPDKGKDRSCICQFTPDAV
jgi:hypothetical protein